jgi:hypothetical protein
MEDAKVVGCRFLARPARQQYAELLFVIGCWCSRTSTSSSGGHQSVVAGCSYLNHSGLCRSALLMCRARLNPAVQLRLPFTWHPVIFGAALN